MKYLFSIALTLFFFNVNGKENNPLQTGASRTDLYLPSIMDKRIAVVANHTSLIGTTHLVDSLIRLKVNVKCIFAPEHGFRGQAGAGEKVKTGKDSITGITVISLYGKHLKPTKEDLKGIETVVFDIQDVGVRFYTYISTLQYVMEACAENNIPLIVLDRPNPNGYKVDGPVLDKKYSSFIGMQQIPVMYGMTIGEYAKMLNGEKWLKSKPCNLKVIPIANYTHDTEYDLPVAPSPNLKNMDAIYLYPSLCFFEGTKVSVGRGTEFPFQVIGFPGMKFAPFQFTPVTIPGVVTNPPYRDTLCAGLNLSGAGTKIREEEIGIKLLWLRECFSTYPDTAKFFTPFFEKLSGTSELRMDIRQRKSEAQIKAGWKKSIDAFLIIRKKYLLYD